MTAPNPSKRRCIALARSGAVCTRWALDGSEPPICAAHRDHGYNALQARQRTAPPPNSVKDFRWQGNSSLKFTDEIKSLALEMVRNGSKPAKVAQVIGISRATLYRHLNDDPEFGEAWKHAEDTATDFLEETLYELAKSGHYNALMAQLKARRPEVYRDDKAGVQVNIGGTQPQVAISAGDQAQQLDRIKGLLNRLPDNQRQQLALPDGIIDAEVVSSEESSSSSDG